MMVRIGCFGSDANGWPVTISASAFRGQHNMRWKLHHAAFSGERLARRVLSVLLKKREGLSSLSSAFSSLRSSCHEPYCVKEVLSRLSRSQSCTRSTGVDNHRFHVQTSDFMVSAFPSSALQATSERLRLAPPSAKPQPPNVLHHLTIYARPSHSRVPLFSQRHVNGSETSQILALHIITLYGCCEAGLKYGYCPNGGRCTVLR